MDKLIPLVSSLRFRLIASVVTIEVIMLSILVWNNVAIIHSTHTDRLRDTASSMIQQIAATAGRYMVAVDYASLKDYLGNIITYKELVYVVILDRDNHPVITLGSANKDISIQIDQHPKLVDDGIYDIAEEISIAEQPMGRVLMGFSLASMEHAISRSRARGITIAVIEIILTISVTVLLGLGLTRRLAQLAKAAADVEAGDYSVMVPSETNDEVGRTVTAFNRMVAEVSSRSEQLQQAETRARHLLQDNRQLIHASLNLQEDERKHMARELHDELGQCLTAIQADASLIRDLAHAKDQRIETSANAILQVSARVYDVVHSMIHRLRPSILDNLGLVEALQDEVAAWNNRNKNAICYLKTDGDLSALGERLNINIYRIVQECLTNIAKYADADEVGIELVNHGDRLQLTMHDNGRGFDQDKVGNGFGLIGMRERVASLGGTFELDSKINDGVLIAVNIPVEQSAN